MATPQALVSPNKQGPKSLPNPTPNTPDLSDLSALSDFKSIPTPKMPAPSMPTPQPTQAPPAEGAQPSAPDLSDLSALAEFGSNEPKEPTSWEKIKKGLEEHGPGFVGGSMGAAIAEASGLLPGMVAGGMALGGPLGGMVGGGLAITAGAGMMVAGSHAAKAIYEKGKRMVDDLADWASGDPKKQQKAWEYIKQELSPPTLDQFGGDQKQLMRETLVNAPLYAITGPLMNRFVLSATARGIDIAALEKASVVKAEWDKSAGEVSKALKLLPGMAEDETGAAVTPAQRKMISDIARGDYGKTAQTEMAGVIENNARVMDSKFKDILTNFNISQQRGKFGDIQPLKASEILSDWIKQNGARITKTKNDIFGEVGDKYAQTADPENILEMVQAALAKRGLLGKNKEFLKSEAATPSEIKLGRYYTDFRNKVQDYSNATTDRAGMTMEEFAKAGENPSAFSAQNPNRPTLGDGTASYSPSTEWSNQKVQIPGGGKATLGPYQTEGSYTRTQINLPSQTEAPYGVGSPTRSATVKELNNFVDRLQELHGESIKAGERISGDIGDISKNVNAQFYQGLSDALPKGDPRGALLKRFSSQYAKNIDMVSELNSTILDQPHIALRTLIKPGNGKQTSQVFHVLNQEAADTLRAEFFTSVISDAKEQAPGVLLTGGGLKRVLGQYSQEQMETLLGSKESLAGFNKALNLGLMIERTSPTISGVVKDKQAAQLAEFVASVKPSVFSGVMNVLRTVTRDDSAPLAKVLDSVEFQTALAHHYKMRALQPVIKAGQAVTAGAASEYLTSKMKSRKEQY